MTLLSAYFLALILAFIFGVYVVVRFSLEYLKIKPKAKRPLARKILVVVFSASIFSVLFMSFIMSLISEFFNLSIIKIPFMFYFILAGTSAMAIYFSARKNKKSSRLLAMRIALISAALVFATTFGAYYFSKVFVFDFLSFEKGLSDKGENLDYLAVNKFYYGFRLPIFPSKRLLEFGSPKRGDVLLFKWKAVTDHYVIKRCIGVPGDIVEIKGGEFFINGKKTTEPYLGFDKLGLKTEGGGPVTVFPKSYFVVGDDREKSFDSRHGGVIKDEWILGKIWLIFRITDSGIKILQPHETYIPR